MLAGPAAEAREGAVRNAGTTGAIEGSFIVVLKDTVAVSGVDEAVHTLAARHAAAVDRTYRAGLRGFAARMSERQARLLAADPAVAYVEQNRVVRFDFTQADPPWGLDRIDQRTDYRDREYNYEVNASAVRAYIIDTGIRISHDDFGTRASYGRDLHDGDSTANDCYGHGTHVAGTVGGSTHGVAKGVRLVAVKVAACDGSNSLDVIIDGVEWVTANHVSRRWPT